MAFRTLLKQVNQLKIKFKDRQNELHEAGLDEKAAQMVQKEAFKHKLLRNLKADGGPFDSVEDIEKYMRTPKSEKEKYSIAEIHQLVFCIAISYSIS